MNVVAGQQRYSHEPLQRGPQVAAHHDREPVDLAGEGERQAFELLVVLELDRVQAGELDGDGRGARDAGGGVVVGDVHLAHIAPGDHVALRRTPVAGDENTAGVLQRDDRGSVRQLRAGIARLCTAEACR
jgi:hypothetical protein